MGCLNSKGNFSHWFGNIHLSGPCHRKGYDPENGLVQGQECFTQSGRVHQQWITVAGKFFKRCDHDYSKK